MKGCVVGHRVPIIEGLCLIGEETENSVKLKVVH